MPRKTKQRVKFVPTDVIRPKQDDRKNTKRLEAKTKNQQLYIDTIINNKITFCSGIAGTGKTKIGISMAMEGMLDNKYDRIVITRPVVQAGENLGHLPGSFEEKLNPYLMPLFDEIETYLTDSELRDWQANGKLEIAPIAFMRGRNFHNTFIVADEAQNMTEAQLIMLLTRIGKNSKMVINGDPTQCDLPNNKGGAFMYLLEKLQGVTNLGTVYLDKHDVIREQIVADIMERLGLDN